MSKEAPDEVRAYMASQEASYSQTETRQMLGQAQVSFVEKLKWAHVHHRRAKRLGVQLSSNYNVDTITTQLLLQSTSDGYVFVASPRRSLSPSSLRIENHSTENDSTQNQPLEWWNIETPQDEDGHIVDVRFDSTAGRKYRREEQTRIIAQFMAEQGDKHPWLAEHAQIGKPGDEPTLWRPKVFAESGMATVSGPNSAHLSMEERLQKMKERMNEDQRRESILHEFERQLKRGENWDYPEDLYVFPLGLILQAGKVLGLEKIP